jgi:hypothetical protein
MGTNASVDRRQGGNKSGGRKGRNLPGSAAGCSQRSSSRLMLRLMPNVALMSQLRKTSSVVSHLNGYVSERFIPMKTGGCG